MQLIELIPASYQRTVYHTCKQYFAITKSAQSKWFHRLNWATFLYSFYCLSAEAYIMANDYPWELWRYEPFTYYFYKRKHLYDPFLFAISFLFVAFNFCIRHVMYHLPTNANHWKWVHEQYVTQQDWYYHCAIKDTQKLSGIYTKKYQDIMAQIESVRFFCIPIPKVFIEHWINLDMFLRMENLDKAKFFSKPLAGRPNLSMKIRTRNILVLIALEKINCLLLLGWVFLYVLFVAFYFPVILAPEGAPFPWYCTVIAVPVAMSIFYSISQMITYGLFFYALVAIEIYTTREHCKEMYNKLGQLIKQFKATGTLPILFCHVLERILENHARVCLTIINNNRLLGVSNYVFLLTNIPVNIYMICKISLLNSVPLERAICGIFFVFQVVAYCTLVTFADQGTSAHAIGKYLPTLQGMLMRDRRWLRYKMKFNDLYKRLLIGPKYSINIGPDKDLSRFTLMEVAYIYVGYLLMAFSQIFGSKNDAALGQLGQK